MATIIRIYGPGQTYANETEAWDSVPTDVVASGNSYVLRSTKFESVRSTPFKLSGKNCDATHTVIFEPMPGAGWLDNGAIPRYDPLNGACIKITAAYNNGVWVSNPFVTFRGFMVWQSGGGNSSNGILLDVADSVATDNFVQVSASGSYVSVLAISAGCKCERNIGILLGNGGNGCNLATGATARQLTIGRVGTTRGGGSAFQCAGANSLTTKIIDCVAVNMGQFIDDPLLMTNDSHHNASDGPISFGLNNVENLVANTTFRDTTQATGDWRLKTTSPLLTASSTGSEVGGFVSPPTPATTLTLSGTFSVTTGFTRTLTLGVDHPLLEGQTQDWTISDNMSGVFTSASGTLTYTQQTATLTYSPTAAQGGRTITAHSPSGSLVLSDAVKAFTVTAPVDAVSLTLTGASSGVLGVAQAIVASTDQPLTGSQTQTITLTSSKATFSPTSRVLNVSNQTGSFQVTPTATGSVDIVATSSSGTLNLMAANKNLTVSLPVPVMVEGTNNYEIGPGKQFENWAAFRTFVNSRDLVTIKARVRATYFGVGETITGDLVPVNASDLYDIRIVADLSSSYVMMATALKNHYPNAGTELTITNPINLVRGTRLIGFRYNFHGSGSLQFGTNYGSGSQSYLSGVSKTDSTTVAHCITSGGYGHWLNVSSSSFIRTAGSGLMLALGDGHGTVNANTFVCSGTGVGNGIAYGAYGGTLAYIQNNVFVNCGDEPIVFPGVDFPLSSRYKNNYTDNATNSAKTRMLVGLSALLGSPFVVDKESDLRPVYDGPIYHKGNALAVSIDDVIGNNRGLTPDAGAYQLEPATPLPRMTLTNQSLVGQTFNLTLSLLNSPTTVTCTLTPDAGVAGNPASLIGPLNMVLTVGVASIAVTNVPPGTYRISTTGSNDGGSTVYEEFTPFEIISIEGNAEAPEVDMTIYSIQTNSSTMGPVTVTGLRNMVGSTTTQVGISSTSLVGLIKNSTVTCPYPFDNVLSGIRANESLKIIMLNEQTQVVDFVKTGLTTDANGVVAPFVVPYPKGTRYQLIAEFASNAFGEVLAIEPITTT